MSGDKYSVSSSTPLSRFESLSQETGASSSDGGTSRQRLLVVANRLPYSAVRREENWTFKSSAGGLVSALMGLKEFEVMYIGWPGVNVSDETGKKALSESLAEKKCIPVFIGEETFDQYYNGYCNNIIWRLFHYLGIPQEDCLGTNGSFLSQFAAYKKANQMFADVVNKHYEEGDIVWCHDYHLMFLPKYLKENNSKMKVGWFLHIPFPSDEIQRILPSRSELLHAILAADLLGFHTYDDSRHFVSSCTRVLGLEGTPEGVEDQGRLTRVAVFPVGINPDKFIHALKDPQVQIYVEEFKERFSGRKVILGVDRLDIIKGIPQKILAFEKFLEENVHWHDKIVLLQIAVPTREDIPEYKKLASQVHEIVGRINGKYGSLSEVPLYHLDRTIDFQKLCALYSVTDIALVTSLRDGMNLVSYEFVACQESKKGVLILSEFAGAAQSLGAGAILVNPWDITEVASSISQALNMTVEEREKRHDINFQHVITHTSQKWAETFVSKLNDTVDKAQQRICEVPLVLPVVNAIERYLQSNNRLLILGFNATLSEPVDSTRRDGDQFRGMELKLHPDLESTLMELCGNPKTTVVVLSGSDRNVLDSNFSKYNMWLGAENGMFLRFTRGEWVTVLPEQLNIDWMNSAKHVFEYFTERTPRSHLELRDTSLVWNYKYADMEFGRLQAKDLLQYLWTGPISNASVDVVQGSHSVEVRAVGVTKGAAIDRILGEIVHCKPISAPIDFVLCIGHFLGKDEDIYTYFDPELSKVYMLKSEKKIDGDGRGESPSSEMSQNVLDLKVENYFSCTVGRTYSRAHYCLETSDEVVKFLKELAAASSSS